MKCAECLCVPQYCDTVSDYTSCLLCTKDVECCCISIHKGSLTNKNHFMKKSELTIKDDECCVGGTCNDNTNSDKKISIDCCKTVPYLSKDVIGKLKPVLYTVFFINIGMFVVEFVSGLIANSSSLIADSLDMLGDAFVYGLSIFVLAKHQKIQAKASVIKGIIMLAFGAYIIWEVFDKITHPIVPTAEIISYIGVLALIANIICFILLTRHKGQNINLKSAWTCSRNDLFSNTGVIGAGILVGFFNSMWPDVIIGLGIAALVIYFSINVIRESLTHAR